MVDLKRDIYTRYNISCKVTSFQGIAWFRLSACVYNDMDDFIKLEEAVLELIKEDNVEIVDHIK